MFWGCFRMMWFFGSTSLIMWSSTVWVCFCTAFIWSLVLGAHITTLSKWWPFSLKDRRPACGLLLVYQVATQRRGQAWQISVFGFMPGTMWKGLWDWHAISYSKVGRSTTWRFWLWVWWAAMLLSFESSQPSVGFTPLYLGNLGEG